MYILPVELEPRRVRPEVEDLFVSLGATQEDHMEVTFSWSITSRLTSIPVIDGKRKRCDDAGGKAKGCSATHSEIQ